MTLPGRSVQPSARGSLLAAALLYVVVTAYGVVNDGYHSDDWRHLTRYAQKLVTPDQAAF